GWPREGVARTIPPTGRSPSGPLFVTCDRNPGSSLGGEPDHVEMRIQEVARRDRPAAHARVVRDHAIPEEGGDHVRLLVEEALLELPDELLALLGIAGVGLAGVQAVPRPVAVAAPARRGARGGT